MEGYGKKYGIIDWIKDSPEIREEIVMFLDKMNNDPDFFKNRALRKQEAAKERARKAKEIYATTDIIRECTYCHCDYPRTPEFWHRGAISGDGLSSRCKFCISKIKRRKMRNARKMYRMERRVVSQ